MEHRVELKIEEIKGEIKFLMGAIEWVGSIQEKAKLHVLPFADRETRSRNLIDNVHEKLAQTEKKLIDVKRVCTEATKHCLKVQLENVRFFCALATESQNLLRNIFPLSLLSV